VIEIGAIVWGVKDVARAVEFWTRALNYELKYPMADDWAILAPKDGSGVQLSLNRVASEKAKRHHMDLFTLEPEEEIARLISLGATRMDWRYPPDADFTVLRDPDGNPFCVVHC